MSLFNPSYQSGLQTNINANEAKVQAEQAVDRMRELEVTVSHMALTCQAMWELLRERAGITDAELLAKIKEVDLRDGTADGRMTPVIVNCPKCGKPSNTKHSQCMYCGAAIPKPHVFQ
ncbi:MAG TPA: hypothetical protein VKV04_13520 [Verrucomicrobiae bacterium]|nr:hypothetical protein [Verrucomicrobiae bacterium]